MILEDTDSQVTSPFGNLRRDRGKYLRFVKRAQQRPLLSLFKVYSLPGFQAIAVHRFGEWAAAAPRALRHILMPLHFLMHTWIRIAWGIDIIRTATIGPSFYIGHFGGIVISGAAVIGENCSISHGVTIGVGGTGERSGAPTIGNGVYIGPGAKIFGKIRIGDGAKIGANAVVNCDIAPGAIAYLSPGFVIHEDSLGASTENEGG